MRQIDEMASNHVNGSNGSLVTNGHTSDSTVQLIVNDFVCSQLALKGYNWTPNSHDEHNRVNVSTHLDVSRRTKIGEALRALGQSYVSLYEEDFAQMCERLQVMPSTAFATFESVSNELFIEGIKWSHIVTYLVFGTEFALYCVHKGFPYLVDEVSHWLAAFISTHLLDWINDHNGWEGVIEFAKETIGETEPSGHWKFGLKDIICGAAGALGVITLGLFLTSRT